MKLYNEAHEPITENEVNLNEGFIREEKNIKKDAVPIDNVTKFAWDEKDWETIRVYVKNKPHTEEITRLDEIEAQATYTAMQTGTLIENGV